MIKNLLILAASLSCLISQLTQAQTPPAQQLSEPPPIQLAEADSLLQIYLERDYYFVARQSGESIQVPAGGYRVEALDESQLRLERDDGFVVDIPAERGRHLEDLDASFATAELEEDGDTLRILLFRPDATVLDAVGSGSGVVLRGSRVARTSYALNAYQKKQIATQTWAQSNPARPIGQIAPQIAKNLGVPYDVGIVSTEATIYEGDDGHWRLPIVIKNKGTQIASTWMKCVLAGTDLYGGQYPIQPGAEHTFLMFVDDATSKLRPGAHIAACEARLPVNGQDEMRLDDNQRNVAVTIPVIPSDLSLYHNSLELLDCHGENPNDPNKRFCLQVRYFVSGGYLSEHTQLRCQTRMAPQISAIPSATVARPVATSSRPSLSSSAAQTARITAERQRVTSSSGLAKAQYLVWRTHTAEVAPGPGGGRNRLASLDLGSLTIDAHYDASCTLDPANRVAESNEANNSGQARLLAAGPPRYDLELLSIEPKLESLGVDPNQTNIFIDIRNAGNSKIERYRLDCQAGGISFTTPNYFSPYLNVGESKTGFARASRPLSTFPDGEISAQCQGVILRPTGITDAHGSNNTIAGPVSK